MLFLVRTGPLDLVALDIGVNTLPRVAVQTEAFDLGLRDPRHHAHLDNRLSRIRLGFRLDRAFDVQAIVSSVYSHVTKTLRYILSIRAAKGSVHRIPARRRAVLVRFQRAIAVVDPDFVLLDQQVGGDVGAGDFAAVGAVAEMAAGFGEEVFVGDGHGDGAAQAGAREGIGELGDVVGVGVAG